MPFLLLLLLSTVCWTKEWPRPDFGLREEFPEFALLSAIGFTLAALAFMVALAGLVAQLVARLILRHPSKRERIIGWYSTYRFYHFLAMFGVFVLTLYICGWGWAVHSVCSVGEDDFLLPGAELVLLAPFLGAMVLCWACYYDAERAIQRTALLAPEHASWGRWAYVGYHLRQTLGLVVVPLAFLVLVQGVCRAFPDLEDSPLFMIVPFILLMGAYVVMPWILRVVMGLHPLPAGPLRDRLMQTARRLNFRFSDILQWNTRGVANAMVVGILPHPRYVVLTDHLVSDLDPDEVEAVFGHEVGHVKHHHMAYYLAFIVVSSMVLFAAGLLIGEALKDVEGLGFVSSLLRADGMSPQWTVLPMGLYIFVVFGFLSRRCERQADIYGCRAVSCGQGTHCLCHLTEEVLVPGGRGLCGTGIRTFIQSLEKVASLNGISRSKPGLLQSWQHSTIAKRVDFLQQVLVDPALERRFQLRVGLVKWGLLVGLSALLAAALAFIPGS